MTDEVTNELIWEKPKKIRLGFVKKLRLAINTNKDDMKIEDVLNTPPEKTELNDCLSKNKQYSINDIETIE